MEDRELSAGRETIDGRKEAYEPPEATIVPVELEVGGAPREGGCRSWPAFRLESKADPGPCQPFGGRPGAGGPAG